MNRSRRLAVPNREQGVINFRERKKIMFGRASEFWSEDRNLSVLLAIILIEIFVLPFLPSLVSGRLIIALLNNLVFSFLLLFGVIALTRHRILQVVFGIIVVLIISARLLKLSTGTPWLTGWDTFLSIITTLAFVMVILGHVYKEGPVTSHRILGAVAAYLLIALAFALSYFLIESLNPHSFEFSNYAVMHDDQPWRLFYYFSITTLTTMGYGDITPVQPITRNLVVMEALIGQLYPAILLARLVSLHAQEKTNNKHQITD